MSSSDLIMRALGHIICEPDNATNIKIWPELCTHTHTQGYTQNWQRNLIKLEVQAKRSGPRHKNISSYFFFTVYYKLNFPFKNINPPRSERKEMHAAAAAENRTENTEQRTDEQEEQEEEMPNVFAGSFLAVFAVPSLAPHSVVVFNGRA